jgi:hypothetical protein
MRSKTLNRHISNWRLVVIGLVFLFASLAAMPMNAWGASKDQKRIFDAGISQYNGSSAADICSGGDGESTTGTVNVTGDNEIQMVWSGLISIGFTPEQAAGIMGNMKTESLDFNAAVYEVPYSDSFDYYNNNGGLNGSGAGVGLVQWSNGRRPPFLQYVRSHANVNFFDESFVQNRSFDFRGPQFVAEAQENGFSLDDIRNFYAVEIEYINTETTDGGSYSGIRETATLEEASDWWLFQYERPADQSDGPRDARRDQSSEIFEMWENGELSGGDSCNGNTADNSSLVATAISMSWPDSNHYREIKPEYLAGLQADNSPTNLSYAQDCGHFVATVIRASGTDGNFTKGGTSGMQSYMADHPELWEPIENTGDEADLQPGDVFVVNAGSGSGSSGHILLYIGPQVNGFNIASASYLSRTANLGTIDYLDQGDTYADSRGSYKIFRFIGGS